MSYNAPALFILKVPSMCSEMVAGKCCPLSSGDESLYTQMAS